MIMPIGSSAAARLLYRQKTWWFRNLALALLLPGLVAVPLLVSFAQTAPVVPANRLVDILAPRPAKASRVDLDILFEVNKWAIAPEAKDQLRELGNALASKKLSAVKFEVVGHTDASGGAKDNKLLSRKRAEAVRSYLIQNFGMAPHRLIASGQGEDMLKDALRPRHRVNRRVEIVTLKAMPQPAKAPIKKRSLSDLLGPDR
jgi:outer membrane protein OmpA-like peptidoglycan-associated protein